MALILCLFFVRCGSDPGLGPAEEVLIGVMPSEELSQGQDDQLVQEEPQVSEQEELEATLDVAPAPTTDASDPVKTRDCRDRYGCPYPSPNK